MHKLLDYAWKMMQFLTLKSTNYTLLLIIPLVILNFSLDLFLYETVINSLWLSDDITHISAADSFQNGKPFNLNFIMHRSFDMTAEEAIQTYDKDIENPYGRSYVYYAMLGSFYTFLDTESSDLLYHGIIFGSMINATTLILYFVLIRKYFDIKIALVSSYLLLIFPYFAWESVRILPSSTFYLFAICALFFLKKNFKHYFIFGIFAAAANASHPIGVVLAFSYPLFLLIKKEFRGAIITFSGYFLALIPIFIHNHYFFKDIGQGLYLPLGSRISELLWFLPTLAQKSNNSIFPFISENYDYTFRQNIFDPVFIFQFFIHEFHASFSNYFLTILIFSIFCFISLSFLNFKNKKNTIFTSIFLITIFLTIFIFSITVYFEIYDGLYSDEPTQILPYKLDLSLPEETSSNPFMGLFLIFILPPIVFSLLYIKQKSIFKQVSRFHLFVILFTFVNLILYYYNSYSLQDVSVSNRHYFLMLYLLIPISISGFVKISNIFSNNSRFKKPILVMLLILIIVLPVSFQSAHGISFFKTYGSTNPLNTNTVLALNESGSFIKNSNYDDPLILAPFPSDSYLRTGFHSIGVPSDVGNCTQFNKFLDFFEPDIYFEFRSPPKGPYVPGTTTDLTKIPSKYYFDPVFSNTLTTVYEIKLKNNAIESDVLLDLYNITKNSGKISLNPSYDKTQNPISIAKLKNQSDAYFDEKLFLESIVINDIVLELYPYDGESILQKSVSYIYLLDFENLDKMLNYKPNSKLLNCIVDEQNEIKQFVKQSNDLSNFKKIDVSLLLPHILQSLETNTISKTQLSYIENILENVKQNEKSIFYLGKIFTKLNWENVDKIEAISVTTKLIQHENSIDCTVFESDCNLKNEIKQILKSAANVYEQKGDYSTSIIIWQKIHEYDKSDIDVWLALGHIYENQGNLEKAIESYELYLEYQTNYEIQQKVIELNERL